MVMAQRHYGLYSYLPRKTASPNIDMALTFDDVQLKPQYSEVETRSDVKLDCQFTKNHSLFIPLVASPMDTVCDAQMMIALQKLGGIGCLHRFMRIDQQVMIVENMVAERREWGMKHFPICVSIGANGTYFADARMLLNAGADIILIDVAHGHHLHVKRALEALTALKGEYTFDIIAGNIATANAAVDLEEWGADALRVGIGGGSMCTTRTQTGIGIPQLQAVMDVANVATVPIISDGGIRNPGDVAKALAAGADTVMIGSLFSGTDEAPGELFVTGEWPKEKKMKVFRGSASMSTKSANGLKTNHIEGTANLIEAKGSVVKVVGTILDGVRSSMSYVGVDNLDDFRNRAEFVQITSAGLTEAHPHGLR
jgi:IMP dehydrogenase